MLAQHGAPVLYALFIWWFSTGVILFLDSLPRRSFRWSMLAATGILLTALYGLTTTRTQTSVTDAYLAFTYGLLTWGWLEMSYFMGIITGPRKLPCPPHCTHWRRFSLAAQTSLYHELSIIVAGAWMIVLIIDTPNQVGLWTFLVLWWMRWSAKLNLFLGVRNINADWLPQHLRFLTSYLGKPSINLFFPLAVTIATVLLALLVQSAIDVAETDAFQQTGISLIATLLGLAILEHWFLVLPLHDSALWNWALRAAKWLRRKDRVGERQKTRINTLAISHSPCSQG